MKKNLSFSESYHLPVSVREWIYTTIIEDKKRENEEMNRQIEKTKNKGRRR